MPGKMTVLDRLISEGRIKKSPFSVKKTSAELRDPLNYPLDMRKDFDKMKNAANTQWVKMTPERVKYQRGLEAIQNRNIMKAQNELDDLEGDKELLQSQWDDAVEEAKNDMYDDWRNSIDSNDFSDIGPDYLEVEEPSTDLSDYWNDVDYMSPREFGQRAERLDKDISEWEDVVEHRESPAYRMELQRQSPRYRNYERAMQQRAANMAMGRDLSRRYAIAYNNLLRRGLTPAEARMYMREYFGGR